MGTLKLVLGGLYLIVMAVWFGQVIEWAEAWEGAASLFEALHDGEQPNEAPEPAPLRMPWALALIAAGALHAVHGFKDGTWSAVAAPLAWLGGFVLLAVLALGEAFGKGLDGFLLFVDLGVFALLAVPVGAWGAAAGITAALVVARASRISDRI